MAESESDNWIKETIDAYVSPLLRYALHFVRDSNQARDIVQDTFLQLCRNPKPELQERMPQWLYTVCRNRAIDVIRKESRVKQMPEIDNETGFPSALEPTAQAPLPCQAIEASEAASGLLKQIATLPDRQQEVLRLKFHGGLSYKEIAEILELTSSNVGFILHTAISKLRQQMVQPS